MPRPIAQRWLRSGSLEQRLVRLNALAVSLVVLVCVGSGAVLLAPAGDPLRVGLFAVLTTAAIACNATVSRRAVARLLAPLRQIEDTLLAAERGEFRPQPRARQSGDAGLGAAGDALNRLLAGRLSDRQRLREVASRAFRAQEAERLRIARELQEETAQTLATVLFRLRAARQAADPAAHDAQLNEIRDDLARATDAIRGYARSLHPPALKELGLVPALEGYARSLGTSSGLAIQILADEVQGLLPLEGELALYRIVQEALGNTVRHARATTVLVRVRRADDYIKTLVEDDGRGFVLEEAEARLPCLGLFGMRERALSVGGTVEIDSIPGDGTQVRVAIPVAASPAASAAPWPVIVGRPADGEPPPAAPDATGVPLPVGKARSPGG